MKLSMLDLENLWSWVGRDFLLDKSKTWALLKEVYPDWSEETLYEVQDIIFYFAEKLERFANADEEE